MVKLFRMYSNLCDHNPPTLQTARRTYGQTDRRTDRETTCDGNTALCTKVHRAVKTVNFTYPPLFDAHARGNPLECRDEIWHQKTRIVALPECAESMTLAFFVLIQYGRDGQTDTLLSQRPALAQRRAGKKCSLS